MSGNEVWFLQRKWHKPAEHSEVINKKQLRIDKMTTKKHNQTLRIYYVIYHVYVYHLYIFRAKSQKHCRWFHGNPRNHTELCCVNVYHSQPILHDDVIKWKHFPRYSTFVRGIHRSPVNSPNNGQWRGALMFSLIYTWINDWVYNCGAGDLRRHHGHYNVIVIIGLPYLVLSGKR